MLHVTKVRPRPNRNHYIEIEHLLEIASNAEVKALCERYRETKDLEDKLEIYALLASGDLFFIDIDGDSHINGNAELDFEAIARLIPHQAWYISPSGTGMKLLIKVSRDCTPSERKSVRGYLLERIAEITGLMIDHCRTDIAFVSDFPVHLSDGIFEIPEVLEKVALTVDYEASFDCSDVTDELAKLDYILEDFPHTTTYNKWLAVVMAALSRFGADAIPLLEAKWESTVPYSKLLEYASQYKSGYLDVLWNQRVSLNDIHDREHTHDRRMIAGATGSGKSRLAIDETSQRFDEPEAVFKEYVIYVTPSVEQAMDVSKKFGDAGISYEILVSQMTYDRYEPSTRSKLSVTSSCNKAVKIIQLAALQNNSYYKHVIEDHRRLAHMYIDELTLVDFVRPSLQTSSIVRAFLGIDIDDNLNMMYRKNYSKADHRHALKLVDEGNGSHFVSSILFQAVDTTVLSTEELTIHCLEELGFKKTVIGAARTATFINTCTLHVSVSDDYVLSFVQNDTLKAMVIDMNFDNVFANKCEFADGNLMTIKGQHRPGRNLTVLRCLPREVVKSIQELYTSCFRNAKVDPVALYYMDSLMQAVGRSIGHRDWSEAWVMVHPRVWSLIKNQSFIYGIKSWNVEVSTEFRAELDAIRRSRNENKSMWYEAESDRRYKSKLCQIRNRLTVSGDPKDKFTPSMVKQTFGVGFTLPMVAEALGVAPKPSARGNYIPGVRSVI